MGPSPTEPYLLPGVFLIGNHADELTPWVPVLATLCEASGYLSIPCCPWGFDGRFQRSGDARFGKMEESFVERLQLGGDGNHGSSYSQYRIWLACVSAECGWAVESETLRIGSTRNWALVGRTRTGGEDAAGAAAIMRDVRHRGLFRTRRPEGKAGEH